MQHRQMWQQRMSNFPDRRVHHRHSHRSASIPLAIVQGNPVRPGSSRPLRFIAAEAADVTYTGHEARVDAHFGRWDGMRPGALFDAQEEAARRIAQRLHDESSQMLATVYLELAAIARGCPDSTVPKKIDRVVKHLDVVREQLRGLSHELSPPMLDQLGLMPALRSLAEGVRERSGLKLAVTGSLPGLSKSVEIMLYRVVQEALSNVVRHAGATTAEVRLAIEGDRAWCIVSDDGVGFERDQRGDIVYGLGLIGIQERVHALRGRLRIVSRCNRGSELRIDVPL